MSSARPAAGSVVVFLAATFAVAWVLWLGGAAIADESWDAGMRQFFFLPGTFAPGVVAIWLTHRAGGAEGVRQLLRRLFIWRVGLRWYAFALGYMAAAKLLAAGIYRIAVGEWPAFGPVPLYLLLGAAVLTTPFQAGEEIGWRGFALPRLIERFGLAGATLLLGVIWAVWHIPLFIIPATDNSGEPFLAYVLAVTALSVALGWLWACTRGSLLLVMLMHAAINNTAGIVPAPRDVQVGLLTLSAPTIAWLTTAVLWVGAAYLLIRMARLNGSMDAQRSD